MQHSQSTDEVIGKSVPFPIFLRNQRAYKLAFEAGDAQVKECIKRTKEDAEENDESIIFNDTLHDGVLMQYVDRRAMSHFSSMLSEQLTQSSEEDYYY